ncbi:MAG: YicC family protein [Tyzzerella sp.]|uniref:YicC family protein n=1 Tax=Candidatus Fimicola merdigallinarum TaxID=2840819 RepID=A0A9D9DWP1_9FIRM|nr:YicC family protein [Candidatus Fimicola merdigallinarum]
MIKSMTGYGRGESLSEDRKFTVEIKSVNHRYNDISIKLPRSMIFLEDKIRKTVSKSISRGKTDVYIGFETLSKDDICVKLNETLAQAYVEKLDILKDKFDLEGKDTLSLVAKFPDVITVEKVQSEEDVIWDALYPALDEALKRFIEMRSAEGEALKQDIVKKADNIKLLVDGIKERAPFVVLDYKEKLTARLKELMDMVEIDEQRIATEVAIFADRGCIDEEITRLESHIVQLLDILSKGGLVGRKLDFLIQEMNRESNTIASKSNDISITNSAIELKSEIEKIREQIQNIE